MTTNYDGIILGAGHNSLVLQAYAGRAGLTTVCLERRDVLGGGLSTEEFPDDSGFLHNTHAFYFRALTRMPWYVDLELERHGARCVQPALNAAMICRDGRVLEWWTDFEKTAASFAQFSERDAQTLRRWRDDFRPIVQRILTPEEQSPPLPPAERQRLLEQTAEGRLLLETSKLSPRSFVHREFTHPVVQAGLLFLNGLREVDLRLPGFGHHIPALFASDAQAQMCIGGSHRLAEALAAAVRAANGEIRLNVTPRRIVVENGRTIGVETTDGELIRARRFVVSGLNPQQTFLELIEKQHLPYAWRKKAANYRYNSLAPMFSLNLNLSEPPDFQSAAHSRHLDSAFMVILGLNHVDQFFEIVSAHKALGIPPTVMWGTCPTLFDPSQAPAGKHTAFMWEKLPYSLDADSRTWDQQKQQHGRKMLQLWSEYAPNLGNAVIDSFTLSPLDVERTLPNMLFGDLLVGTFAHGQVGYHRPFPGAGHYRGHIEGLYLCGSCCHPGGNITGLPGYNCAQVMLGDLGIKPFFAPEPIADQLARLASRPS